MGGAKREMEEMDAKRSEATRIAIDAGVLKECEWHDSCYFEGSDTPEEAYKFAAHKLKAGELHCNYKNQKELTDIVQDVIRDYSAADECPMCAKRRDE